MSRTFSFSTTLCRSAGNDADGDSIDDEFDVIVDYSYVAGASDTYDRSRGGPGGWDPGYPAEITIEHVWRTVLRPRASGQSGILERLEHVDLTDAEAERICSLIAENHEEG